MDASLLSALSALGGAIIGGLTLLLASFFAQRSQARVLGSTVIGGMLAASGIAIFFIPVTFYVVERLSSRAGTSPSSATARTTGRSGCGTAIMSDSGDVVRFLFTTITTDVLLEAILRLPRLRNFVATS